MNRQLFNFFVHGGPDNLGRTLNDILNLPDEGLEACHNHVQWIMPTITPSNYNPDAPLLDDETIKCLKNEPTFRSNFRSVLLRMFKFWQIKVLKGREPIPVALNRKAHWFNKNDHNLLRLSRCMESCKLLGFETTAKALFELMLLAYQDTESEVISRANILFWYMSAFHTINL